MLLHIGVPCGGYLWAYGLDASLHFCEALGPHKMWPAEDPPGGWSMSTSALALDSFGWLLEIVSAAELEAVVQPWGRTFLRCDADGWQVHVDEQLHGGKNG